MIVRQYGKRMESVRPSFSAVAFNSIAWQRDGALTVPVEEFHEGYEQVGEHELTARVEGRVQLEVEQALLQELVSQLLEREADLSEDEVLAVLNRRGVDDPRFHEKKHDLVVEGENRLYFVWWVDPGIRIGVFRRRA